MSNFHSPFRIFARWPFARSIFSIATIDNIVYKLNKYANADKVQNDSVRDG
jgi:hypothetical protein